MISNSFCLGDAVHRHPPFNGLGSNTCIQDAFNLAWKIAYAEKGIAGRSILDSFNAERQPVGQGVVTQANQGIRDHLPVCQALGALWSNPSSKKAFASYHNRQRREQREENCFKMVFKAQLSRVSGRRCRNEPPLQIYSRVSLR